MGQSVQGRLKNKRRDWEVKCFGPQMNKSLFRDQEHLLLMVNRVKNQGKLRFKIRRNILMEMVWRHRNSLLKKVVFVWPCSLLGVNRSKSAAAMAAGRKPAHQCQGVGQIAWGLFMSWNGSVVRVLRAPAASASSAPAWLRFPAWLSSSSCCSPPWGGRDPGAAQPGRAGFALCMVKGHLQGLGSGLSLALR